MVLGKRFWNFELYLHTLYGLIMGNTGSASRRGANSQLTDSCIPASNFNPPSPFFLFFSIDNKPSQQAQLRDTQFIVVMLLQLLLFAFSSLRRLSQQRICSHRKLGSDRDLKPNILLFKSTVCVPIHDLRIMHSISIPVTPEPCKTILLPPNSRRLFVQEPVPAP